MKPTPFGSTPASGTCGTEYSGSKHHAACPKGEHRHDVDLEGGDLFGRDRVGVFGRQQHAERVAVVDGHDPDPAVRVGDAGDHGPTTGNVQAPADQSSWIHV